MFRVGDRVRIIDPIFNSYGQVGEVMNVYTDPLDRPYEYAVDVPLYGPTAFRQNELELVQ